MREDLLVRPANDKSPICGAVTAYEYVRSVQEKFAFTKFIISCKKKEAKLTILNN